jgi:polyhydroxyalkanoate synthase subunit PhaC
MKRELRAIDIQTECPPVQHNAEGIADRLDRAAHSVLAAATCGLSPASAWLAWADWLAHLAISPGKCGALALRAYDDWLANLSVKAGTTDVGAEGAGDPRFRSPGWSNWPSSDWRDAFLRTQAWWRDATTNVRGVDAHHQSMTHFYVRQWLDCMSPSNFPWTNPQVLGRTSETGGANFVAGLRNWLEDFESVAARLSGVGAHRKTGLRVGHELAITPGEVVWRNELFELIQYSPSTATVAREPILIVPSWILKYYILDLQPHNSLIRYLVGEGYTVFAMSWKNPDATFRDLELNAYLSNGLFPAIDEVRRRCENAPVHALGYCLGGTLLAIGAAALARDDGGDNLRTVTLLAAETDFSDPGELGLFIDASELAALDALMWEQGYLDGSQMAAAFQVLNARDLIWSRLMSEYLLGVRSKPDDLASWNADTTRMPYRMHSEYLNALFLRNDLAEGRYCVGGRPVALGDVRQPLLVVGTERDHVSPWRAVYKLHLLTHDELTFLLASRGHNAGIVCPPGTPERHYRVATRKHDDAYRSPSAFFQRTAQTDGSWWLYLAQWLRERSSATVDARHPAGGLCAAPGAYVRESQEEGL